MIKSNLCVILAILFLGGISPASADLVGVSYFESDLGGDVFGYEFFLSNSSDPDDGFGLFFVRFDLGSFAFGEFVKIVECAEGWECFASPEEPIDEIVDAAFITFESPFDIDNYPPLTDIAPGNTLGGFIVQSNLRLSQKNIEFFALLDTYTFDDEGNRILIESPGSVTPVPEPATLILLATGLTAIAFISRKKKSLSWYR